MKADFVIAALRHLIAGESDRGIQIVRQMEAAESSAGNVGVAKRLRSLLDCQAGQFIRLPDAPPSIQFIQPSRTLDSMVVNETVRRQADALVAEWHGRELLREHGLPVRNIILMQGPSGNGKTTLAEAMAHAIGLPLGVIAYEELIDSHMGCTGANVAKALDYASKRPCVLLFDEADAVVSSRSVGESMAGKEGNRIVNTLLTKLDRMGKTSLVIFATNFVELLDPAILRRCGAVIHLPPPENGQAETMAKKCRERWPILGDWPTPTSPSSFSAIEAAAMERARELVLAKAQGAKQ